MKIYTDGSSKPNPGFGGAGAILLSDNNDLIKELVYAGGETTNNRMELYAIIMTFDYIPKLEKTVIYTDSEYVKKGINEWIHNWVKRSWKNSTGQCVKNSDLWKKLLDLTTKYPNVKIEWIKAHNGHKWNERADFLANIGTEKSKTGYIGFCELNLHCKIKDESDFDYYFNKLIEYKNDPKSKDKLDIYLAYLKEAEVDVLENT